MYLLYSNEVSIFCVKILHHCNQDEQTTNESSGIIFIHHISTWPLNWVPSPKISFQYQCTQFNHFNITSELNQFINTKD